MGTPLRQDLEERIAENPAFFSGYKIRKPFLSEEQRLARMEWCKRHKNWTIDEWKKVLFADESPFTIRFQRRTRLWRKRGEQCNPQIMRGTIKHDNLGVLGGASPMMGLAISTALMG